MRRRGQPRHSPRCPHTPGAFSQIRRDFLCTFEKMSVYQRKTLDSQIYIQIYLHWNPNWVLQKCPAQSSSTSQSNSHVLPGMKENSLVRELPLSLPYLCRCIVCSCIYPFLCNLLLCDTPMPHFHNIRLDRNTFQEYSLEFRLTKGKY